MLRFIPGDFYLNCYASACSEILGFIFAAILLKICGFNLSLVAAYVMALCGSSGLLLFID